MAIGIRHGCRAVSHARLKLLLLTQYAAFFCLISFAVPISFIMKKVRITAIRKAYYPDLIEKYENPIQHACDIEEGSVFIANGWEKPDGLCQSAWDSMSMFVMALAHGGCNFYNGWMKNPHAAMISCNDGFRPVSFYIEAIDDNADMDKTDLCSDHKS